jgi:hypothetical protein
MLPELSSCMGGAAPVGRSSWTIPLPRPPPPWLDKGCRWPDFLLTLLGRRPIPLSGRRLSSEAAGGAMEHLGDLLSYMFPDGFKWRGRAYVGASPPWFPPPPGVYALRPLQRGHSRRPELCAAPVSASSRRETLEGWRPGAVGKIVHVGLEEVTQ